jgi:hypothetical protein
MCDTEAELYSVCPCDWAQQSSTSEMSLCIYLQ